MPAPVDSPDVSHMTPDALLGKAGSVFAVAASVVLLRIFVRIRIVKSFGKDDWAMILAMVCTVFLLSLVRAC